MFPEPLSKTDIYHLHLHSPMDKMPSRTAKVNTLCRISSQLSCCLSIYHLTNMELSMEEILYLLGWLNMLKPIQTLQIMGCLPPINWCRISHPSTLGTCLLSFCITKELCRSMQHTNCLWFQSRNVLERRWEPSSVQAACRSCSFLPGWYPKI